MFDLDYWQEIWSTISRNKTRSILTGFGVFWGIFMLLVLIGIGNGLSKGMYKNFEGIATNSSFYFSGQTSVPYKGYRKGRSWDMQTKDLPIIRHKAKTVDLISPMNFYGGNEKNVVYGNKSGTYSLRGVYSTFFEVEKQNVLAGRLLNEFDIDDSKKVCVIGKTVSETLFGNNYQESIGKYIRLNGIFFQVVGVISPKSGADGGGNVEELVIIPFSTMQAMFTKSDNIHFLMLTTKPGYMVSDTEVEVKDILRQIHSIAPNDEKAIRTFNLENIFNIFGYLFMGIDIIIWIVGLGALLSGIIGISNIMIVTIKERTREIGVRRALGAKPFTIMKQILSESFVLTAIAGLLGFVVGIGLLALIENAMTISVSSDDSGSVFAPPFVTFKVAIIALTILMVSGILAGILPALRALSVKAIDAIRDE